MRMRKTFVFQGQTYHYFYHWYNKTWKNERAVEVPIILETVKSSTGRILEVGNVLSHYFPCQHDIVDKYEKQMRVLNEDVVGFKPSKKYDLIVSISTLEHVGLDEEPREPRKILLAIKNLINNCLAPEGKIVITLPIGEKTELDKLLTEGKIPFTRQYYLKKASKGNQWKEVSHVSEVKYDFPFSGVNAITILTIFSSVSKQLHCHNSKN